MPKVSVIIPTHNRPELLKKAIKSVLAQTFQDFEIIVVDDGMEKRADKIVASFKDSRIKYIQHKKEQGGSAAMNTGIKRAKGKYIAILDDDDEYMSEKLEKQSQILEKYFDKIGFVFSPILVCSEGADDKSFRKTVKYRYREGIHNFFELILGYRIKILTPSFMVKKEKLLSVGGFDEDIPSGMDWDFNIRLTKDCNGYFLNKLVAKVNALPANKRITGNLNKTIEGRRLIIKKHFNELKKRPKFLGEHYFMLGKLYHQNKEFRKARNCFLRGWRADKTRIRLLVHFISILFGGKMYNLLKRVYDKYIKNIFLKSSFKI